MPSMKTHFLAAAAFAFAALPHHAAAQWTDGQAAVHVVGQTTFGLSSGATAANRFNQTRGVCLDSVNSKLYVADGGNNRVLRFAYPIAANGPTAEAVFGQPSFTTNTANIGGLSATSMSRPYSLAVDTSGTLYVADNVNHRVLAFPAAHLAATTGTAAARVLGQATFATSSSATTASGFSAPDGLAWEAPDRLWVAEFSNRRVVRFENVSAKPDGAPADGVLGQINFTTRSNQTTTAGISAAFDVKVNQGRVYIADYFNHRILRHDAAASKANGAPADGVLGQPDFTSTGSALSATRLNSPEAVAVDPSGRLYVADRNNRRVMIFDDAASKANGAAADNVLGQPGFVTNAAGSGAAQVAGPCGVAIDAAANRIVVTEGDNMRANVYQASGTLVPVTVSAVGME